MADTCGEKLAWFFGITSPKYQAAIDEYYRLKRQVCSTLAMSVKLEFYANFLFHCIICLYLLDSLNSIFISTIEFRHFKKVMKC